MSHADRAFGVLMASALAVGALLALPLALTLFPGEIQQSLHASEMVMRSCVAALYAIGRDLPPLGIIILTLAISSAATALAGGVRLLGRTARVTRRTAVATPVTLRAAAARTGLTNSLRVFEDGAPIAYTAGLLRPRIWISTALVGTVIDDELDAILWHEREHLLRYDPLRVFAARVITSLFFLVPIIRVQAQRFEVAKELDADRAALRAQRGPAALAGALVALGGSTHLADAAMGAWSMTEVRVDQLCGEDPASLLPRASQRVRALSVAALALALLLAFGQAARANVLPASLIELGGVHFGEAMVHDCPLPTEGVLF